MASIIKALEYKELTKDEKDLLIKLYGPKVESIKMGPKQYCLPKHYLTLADGIYNMELRNDDVFVATYQRSGTTLTQELVWLIANDYNYEKAAEIPLTYRYEFLEHAMFFNEEAQKQVIRLLGNTEKSRKIAEILGTPGVEKLKNQPSPRFIKTHQPMSLLPPKLLDTAKVIYVARDPRDVVVSSYHHAKLFKLANFSGTFKDVWEAFRKDIFTQNPFFEHIKEAWALRNHPNMLFLFYEELTKQMPETIRRVASFLGKAEPTPEQMARLCDHLSIENFKNNKSVNYEEMREMGLLNEEETFIRKGKSGGWRDYFDEEMTAQAHKWISDNLKDTDLRFPSIKI